MQLRRETRRGDTLVEVMVAVTVFSMIAVGTFMVMNGTMARAQGVLEETLARDEMDAQADTLQMIRNEAVVAIVLERAGDPFLQGWRNIVSNATNTPPPALAISGDNCAAALATSGNAILLDPRHPTNALLTGTRINQEPGTYPRLFYGTGDNDNIVDRSGAGALRAEGIWIVPIQSGIRDASGRPRNYDFHIRTCWHQSGTPVASTLGTIVRLHNPEYRGN